MELGGVHHVSINVSNNAAAAKFYTDTLGLEEIPRPDFGIPGTWLKSANGIEIHWIEIEDWVPPKGQHYAFAVADLDAAIGEMRDKGIKIGDAIDIPDTGARQAFTFDPAGNMVEFNQS